MESTAIAKEDNEISSILEDIEITPFFQPIICIKTGKVFAHESLVRGRAKATGALVSPAELFALTDSLSTTSCIWEVLTALRACKVVLARKR